ncbi:MAG: metal ABC transporter permease [Chloroflexi bacterium]|nr:metal ABC transporter permease [Chloroflexota bacterium]
MPEIFQLSFMVRAFIGGGIVGAIAPLLGTFLVLRRLSMFVDSLAHVALAGVAVGLLFNRFPIMVAVGVSIAAAVVLERLRASNRMASDSALALILYTGLAVMVVLVSLGNGFNVDLFGFLFGNIVTVGGPDLWAMGGLAAAVLVLVWLLYGELVQSTFDPDLARVSGVPVWRVNLALAILTGVTVTLSMRVVGALLVGALTVFPVLASLQLGRGFRMTLLVSAALGIVSVFVGLTISYYRDIAAGGAIVLTALGLLVAISVLRGMITRLVRPASR